MRVMLSVLVAVFLSSRAAGFAVEEDNLVPVPEELMEVEVEQDIPTTTAFVSAGRHFTHIGENGMIRAAGRNDRGQLGIGSTDNAAALTEVAFSPAETYIVDAAAGAFHALFLTDAGEVFASGWNRFGQLALGDNVDRMAPAKIGGLENVVSISAGYGHSLFLTGDGQVYSAGLNAMGQLGDGTMTNSNNVVAVPGFDNCSGIAAGYDFSVILDRASDAWTVGNGLGGQLGHGRSAVATEPVKVLTNVQEVAAGESHALFLMVPEVPHRQAVKATGANFDGQLGDGTTNRKTRPVEIFALDDFNTMAAGGDSSCFSSGVDLVLQCAGSNRDGQIGLGVNQTVTTPQTVTGAIGSVLKMSLGDTHSLLLHAGDSGNSTGRIYSTGNNVYGELGDGTNTPQREPIEVTTVDIVPAPTPPPTPSPPTMAPTTAPTEAPGPEPTAAPTPGATPAPTPAPTPSPPRNPSTDETNWPAIIGGGGGVVALGYLIFLCATGGQRSDSIVPPQVVDAEQELAAASHITV